jgi:excisionase family DNA binding protein
MTDIANRLCYPAKEAWHLLGIKRSKFYEEVNAGRIRVKRIGRRLVIPANSLKTYLDNLPDRAA